MLGTRRRWDKTVTNEEMGRWPPWSRQPSMMEMAGELGIDFDELVGSFGDDLSPQQMALRFGISQEMAANLKDHYYKFGISSIQGGD